MKLDGALFAIVLTSASIAALAPFDVFFAAATFGSAVWRSCLMAALAVTGAFFARRAGLKLDGNGAIGIAMAFAVAVYVATLDGLLFRHLLPVDYISFMQSPLPERLLYFTLRAFNENVIYRLFVFSMLSYLATVALRSMSIKPPLALALMISAQILNIGANVVLLSQEPLTAEMAAYYVLRYITPGVLWAWLFFRFGFATAEVASVGCHIFLQPAFSLLF